MKIYFVLCIIIVMILTLGCSKSDADEPITLIVTPSGYDEGLVLYIEQIVEPGFQTFMVESLYSGENGLVVRYGATAPLEARIKIGDRVICRDYMIFDRVKGHKPEYRLLRIAMLDPRDPKNTERIRFLLKESHNSTTVNRK